MAAEANLSVNLTDSENIPNFLEELKGLLGNPATSSLSIFVYPQESTKPTPKLREVLRDFHGSEIVTGVTEKINAVVTELLKLENVDEILVFCSRAEPPQEKRTKSPDEISIT